MPTRRTEIDANFPGAAYPPGTRVRFADRSGAPVSGTVATLRRRYAEVAADDGQRWQVPYPALRCAYDDDGNGNTGSGNGNGNGNGSARPRRRSLRDDNDDGGS